MTALIRTQSPNADELDRELTAILGGAPSLGKGLVRAAGYTRVSSFMQVEDGNSLEDQAARIARVVAEHGWELVEVFADPARSGRNEQRPQLARLLRAVRKNQVDVVVIDRIDRLSRHLPKGEAAEHGAVLQVARRASGLPAREH